MPQTLEPRVVWYNVDHFTDCFTYIVNMAQTCLEQIIILKLKNNLNIYIGTNKIWDLI